MEHLPERIKSLRNSHYLTENQVAEHLGISQQTYSNYELGKHELPTRHVAGLTKLYNVSADYLLGTSPSYTGYFDLNVIFVQNTTLKNVIIHIMKLNKRDRLDLLHFLSYLNNRRTGI